MVPQEYNYWLESPVFNDATKQELKNLTDQKEIYDRFYKQLSFGTGGMRGLIGAGTNRMNIYTVGKATQGLANFINLRGAEGGVAIAYDSRKMSPEFALDSALILAANGIKAYLFESLRPTPELSFAVRELKACAGIVITASHNPPQYNGYKVYWSDGGQIVPPYDRLIIDEINKIEDYSAVKRITREKAEGDGLLQIIGKEIDDKYIEAIKSNVVNRRAVKLAAEDLKIVYTPLNGTGLEPVTRILSELGFKNVWVLPEQAKPDGNFPTLKYPNPEDPAAFRLALKLARQKDADLVLATDPDADRLGVFVKDKTTDSYIPFTGNMSGLVIAEYILSQKKVQGALPENSEDGALVTTIVSSNMAFAVAEKYGLTVIEVLTGFKYIGEQIKLFEKAKAQNKGKTDAKLYAYEYLFGFEESYGCLVGTHARDKDAVAAVAALCEAAAFYKLNGLTLWDAMKIMYKKYGYFKEDLHSVTLTGEDGAKKIENTVDKLRKDIPAKIGNARVIAMRDYNEGVRRTLAGNEQKLTLPKSNVLYFELENDGWCCVRPSGTEPKIKFYFGVKGESLADAQEKIAALKRGLMSLTALE